MIKNKLCTTEHISPCSRPSIGNSNKSIFWHIRVPLVALHKQRLSHYLMQDCQAHGLWPRTALNNLTIILTFLETSWEVFGKFLFSSSAISSVNTFYMWSNTILLPLWSMEAKSLDTPNNENPKYLSILSLSSHKLWVPIVLQLEKILLVFNMFFWLNIFYSIDNIRTK